LPATLRAGKRERHVEAGADQMPLGNLRYASGED
jgi:hypothetical protein